MEKGQKYIVLIILGCLLFLGGVKIVYGGEALKYQGNYTFLNSRASGYYYFKVVSNKNNQYLTKITAWFWYSFNHPNSIIIYKYNANNQLVATTTSIVQYSLDNTYNFENLTIYPNLILNQGEYLIFGINNNNNDLVGGIVYGNYEVFNNEFFTGQVNIYVNWWETYNYPLLKVYTLTPDNPQVYQFSPAQGLSFGSNFFSLNFTSSTPLSFYVSNAQDLRFNFYIKDYFHKDFDYQFSITIPLSLAQSTNKFDFDFKNLKVRINNGDWVDFSQFTGFMDNAYFGDVFIKVEAVNLLNNLTGSGIVQYKFPAFSGAVSEESLGLFFYNADNNSALLPFYDCGSPSNSSTTPETYNANRLKIEVFSCGLISGQSYQLKFALINTTDNDILFQDFQNYLTGDFKYSQVFTLETNKLYKVLYWLYRGGVLVYMREVWFQVSQITSPFLTFTQFYQSKITGFGLPSSTTPTPAFASFGSFIDKIFNPVNLFLTPDKNKIDNLKNSIIQNINNFIGYISGFNNQLGYFSLLFYGLIIFLVIEVVVKMYKLISPFK
jgi:hypothetical protein